MKNIFSLLPVLLLSGCALFVAPQVNEFDLAVKHHPGTAFRVAAVRNLSHSGQRFLLRSGAKLTRDPYNIWTSEPGTLICNALNRIGSSDPSAAVFICDVERFEVDLYEKFFRISGSFRRQGTARNTPFDITVPLENNSSESIVSAASSAVEKLAELLRKNQR
ncbi:MAG: hypothetical protein IKC05_10425 [Lentisphaeria bacterium]|nr:hypothetical protein [Lentisphaeria bacterium]